MNVWDYKCKEKRKEYIYGAKHGRMVCSMPSKGFITTEDDWTGMYKSIMVYNRPLTADEQEKHELKFLGVAQ